MNRFIILVVYILQFCFCMGQDLVNNKLIYDEYGTIYTQTNDSSITYISTKGKKYEVKLYQVYFIDGEDNLIKNLKQEYYREDNSDNYAYRVFFFMLFDSKLRIKEVRGVTFPLNKYSESKKKRMELYTKGLKNTKSKWKKITNQKWYVYCFSFVTD